MADKVSAFEVIRSELPKWWRDAKESNKEGIRMGKATRAGVKTQWLPEEETGVPGIVSGIAGIPAIFGVGGWPEEMSNSYNRHLNAMLAAEGLPDSAYLNGPERAALALGEVGGQFPLPGKLATKVVTGVKGRLGTPASLITEYFTPWISPHPVNYAAGTVIGGGLRQLEEPSWERAPEMEQQLVREHKESEARRAKRAQIEGMLDKAERKERDRLYNKYFGDADITFSEPKGYARGGLRRMGGADAVPPKLQGTQIIKEPGGNWLYKSIEDALVLLKSPIMPNPAGDEELILSNLRNTAINQWIDKKLAGYMRNEMGTLRDPLREQAERGILHYTPDIWPGPRLIAKDNRIASGMPTEGVGVSDLARDYESLTDSSIAGSPAYDWLTEARPATLDTMPWLNKIPPETKIYEVTNPDAAGSLGFEHLVDELQNAVNPASGLPPGLLIDPDKLYKMSTAQISEHVAKINDWRSAQKAVADKRRAMNAATVIHKEYPDDPQGMRWVEMKLPEKLQDFDASHFVVAEGPSAGTRGVLNTNTNRWYVPPTTSLTDAQLMKHAVDSATETQRTALLDDALKYEGEQLAHCVGGYCPKVVSGDSRIFSLRDAEGKPYTTIEAVPRFTSLDTDLITQKLHSELGRVPTQREVQDVLNNQNVMRINQIKGPRNLPPSEKYLPFVQDFVRSGNWSSVGDLSNAGMRRLPDNRYITNSQFDEAIQKLTGEGEPSVNAEWLARQINADPAWWENAKGAFEGFANGGLVDSGYNAEHVDTLANQLMEEVYGQR